jgi:hypothetical protein
VGRANSEDFQYQGSLAMNYDNDNALITSFGMYSDSYKPLYNSVARANSEDFVYQGSLTMNYDNERPLRDHCQR